MTEPTHPDALKRFVIFLVVLVILGLLLALPWYFAVELPIRLAAGTPPLNPILG